MKKINYWINGKNVVGNDYFQIINLVIGDVLVEVVFGGEVEVNQVVVVVKEVFLKWVNLLMKECVCLMCCFGDLIDQYVLEIVVMEIVDIGLFIYQIKNVLILCVLYNFEFFVEVCQQMNGKIYLVDDKMFNYMLVQFVGVCVLVLLWNVLFMIVIWKVVLCLVLGNIVVFKMFELLLLIVDRLGELVLEVGILVGVLNVVQGYGVMVGDVLVCYYDVCVVLFIGGIVIGCNIMKNVGLKKYLMELGGKLLVLIFEDVDIECVLDVVLFIIFLINGECCIVGLCIFIQQSIYFEFVKCFVECVN